MKRNLKGQEYLFSKIKTLRDFEFLKKSGKKIRGKFYLFNFIKGSGSFGIIVSKKVGNSVTRNYEKRVIRELIRKYLALVKDYDIVIVRLPNKNGSFLEKESDFLSIIEKITYEHGL